MLCDLKGPREIITCLRLPVLLSAECVVALSFPTRVTFTSFGVT